MTISPEAVSSQEVAAAATAAGVLGAHEVTRASIEIPSGDGAPLGADVFRPADGREGPVLLMRTAYGRGEFSAQGVYFASHGYHCILQDTRGTSSYFHEKSDGAAAAAWIARQPWYNGALGLFGTSYMGFTAYATAASRPAGLRAMAVSAYSADRVSAWYPGGSFGLDLALPWAAAQAGLPGAHAADAASTLVADDPAFLTVPLSAADRAFCGQELPFYQERLSFGSDDPHWAPLDFSHLLQDGTLPPTLLIDGWYDYHRPYLWADFLRLHASRHGDRAVEPPHRPDPQQPRDPRLVRPPPAPHRRIRRHHSGSRRHPRQPRCRLARTSCLARPRHPGPALVPRAPRRAAAHGARTFRGGVR
jgi:uncharacterized protein